MYIALTSDYYVPLRGRARAQWLKARGLRLQTGSRIRVKDSNGAQTLHFLPEARWRIYNII